MFPTIGRWGSFTLYTHDAFSLLAIVVGTAIFAAELRRRGWLDSRIFWISLAGLLGAALGARLITAWERPDAFADFGSLPVTLAIERSGKSIIGAIAGGYLAIAVAKRAFGYTRSLGDGFVLAIPIATAVGRIGCFLTELPLGTPTTLPWGVSVSPLASAAFPTCPFCGGPMHPTMAYEIAFNLVAAGLIWRFRGRVPAPGDALKLYLLGAAAFRFLVEYLRTSPKQALDLTAPQWVLIPVVGLLALHFARQAVRGAWRIPVAPSPDLHEVLA
jgi:phosphatidylglycerol---prolipoprotein diacylglyceryl transferase